MPKFSPFSETIYKQKYAHINGNNQKETWSQISKRVVNNVLSVVFVPKDIKKQIIQYIDELKFIPGGRYLYAAGLPYHQTQNCFLFKAQDSREGWADLLQKSALALMTGGGIGTDYSLVREEGRPIRKIKGFATGPISLAKIVNEAGRYIMQGGSRRSAIWAGLKWDHPDIYKFINSKNWIKEVRELKTKDFSFPADLDMTNISVLLNDEFFEAYRNDRHPMHSMAHAVYWATVERMLKTSEPGFSIDCGSNKNETLRNACQPCYAKVLTPKGIENFGNINIGDEIWSGKRWTKITHKNKTGIKSVYRYRTTTGNFVGTKDHRIIQNNEKIEIENAESIDWCIGEHVIELKDLNPDDIMDGLVIGDGSVHKASGNLVYLCVGEKDQDYLNSEIEKLLLKYRPGLHKGAYEIKTSITSNELPYTYLRTIPARFYYGNSIKKKGFLRGLFTANGCVAGNRVSLKQSSKELIIQVQEMLSSLGIHSYITTNKSRENKFYNGIYVMKESYDLNITTGRTIFKNEIGFIQHYKQNNIVNGKKPTYKTSSIKEIEYLSEEEVYEITVADSDHTYWTGGCLVSNCTEITSSDDADVCNLGSINLGKIESLEEMKDVVECATIFLLAGTIYSDVPFAKVDEVRNKNRRIGLGLMGMHEFLLKRNQPYGINDELNKYLNIYSSNQKIANIWSKKWDISRPIKTRSIAPTGTIAIVAGTTTGIEPLFCSAYKRRYLKGKEWHYQYVIDNITEKMIEMYGLHPDDIEDAYSLAKEPWRRMDFQKWVQTYVDHAISSTMNIPAWGSVSNNKDTVRNWGNLFLKYLPDLRGMTVYADGSRGGQPLQPIKYSTAKQHIGEVFRESNDLCEITGSGSCGS